MATGAELAEGMRLRPLVEADVEAISAIHVAACRIAYVFMDWDYSLAEVRDWYAGRFGEWDWATVAELGADVTGYLAMSGRHIDQLFVDPDCQRQGIGGALLAAALQRGLRPLTLDVFEDNHAARRLYQRHGFSQRDRRFNEQDRAMQLRYALEWGEPP